MSNFKNKYLLVQEGFKYLKSYVDYKELLKAILNTDIKELSDVVFSREQIRGFYVDDSDKDGLFPMYFIKKSLKEQIEVLIFKLYEVKYGINVGPVYFNGVYVSLWLYGKWVSVPVSKINSLIKEKRVS